MAASPSVRYPGYDDLLDSLYRTRDWWRTIYILERVFLFVTGLFAAVLVLTLLEAHLHFSRAVRWPLLAVLAGYFAGGLAWLVFRPLFHEWTEEEVAVHVERKFPQLDNELINALQLGVDKRVESPGMVAALIQQAVRDIQAYPLRQAVETRRARRLALAAMASVLALGLWAGLAFDRFTNALQRLVFPAKNIAALGSVRILEVKPGDTRLRKGTDLEILVQTQGEPSGEVEANLRYQYADGGEALAKALIPLRRDLYTCRVEDVRSPLAYQVTIGGSQSKSYHVEIVEPPIIIKRSIAYTFPTYTRPAGWTNRVDEDTNGDVRAPADTTVALRFTTNKAIKNGSLQMTGGQQLPLKILEDPRQQEVTFVVDKDGVYTVQLEDVDGITNPDQRENKIIALKDRAPIVEFKAPAKDITAGARESVKLAIGAKDDYALSAVRLVARRGKDGPQKVLYSWEEFPSAREVTLPYLWVLGTGEEKYQVGDEIFYYAVALDNHAEFTGGREVPKPQETKTAEFKITIEDKDKLAAEKAKAVSNWETELRKVLEDQLAARATVGVLARQQDMELLRKDGDAVHKAQTDIFARTAAVAKAMKPTDDQAQAIKESIELLAYGEMTQCAKLASTLPKFQAPDAARQTLEAVGASQDKIIKVLRQLLNILPDLAQEGSKDKIEDEKVEDFPDEDQEKMKDLLKNLKDMVRQQKKAIETTDELAKLPMEDFTPEAEKKLEEVKAIEEKWSQFLKAAISDLSKMQDQDFANGTLLEELVEIHTEIEMAKDALQSKATEIATALEDNGLMLAEKLTKQLEKWLPDTPDRDRWQMEEPLTDGYETPMAELPKELEDIVGDLMEEEEDLQQEIEDATSAWADSMDAAGWDAMDGPISNFAANGVTGNRLPNSSELSGRSGEGRQGKSTGEFVENQFDGKGGRRTPTRLTPEAFQKGQIKDTSSTPPGGATGGGKAGGSSGEGLEGPTPPDIQMKMKDLALKQAQLRNKAEKIALKFEVLNYPPVFEPVVKDMKVLEAALNSGRYMEARRQHNVVLNNLKGTRMFLDGEVSIDAIRSPTLPAHLQEEIIDTAGAAVPEEFKDYIKGYYDAISRAGQ
ncbi:MAG TPA: hypothetical protein P5118_14705 [Planctomycetota bacterium]|nr:hypothetical protein [Planctomycetota bacterium]